MTVPATPTNPAADPPRRADEARPASAMASAGRAAPRWRWELAQTWTFGGAQRLGGLGWEPYAVHPLPDGSAIYYLKRPVKNQ